MTDSASSEYLDARYGRRGGSPARARLLAGTGVAVLVGLVVLLFVWSSGGNVPQATVSGYHVDSPTQTTVDFTVDKAAGARVSCRVEAQDQYTDIVGSVDVTLPAGQAHVASHAVVPTRQLAVIGLVDSCRVLG